MIHDLEPYPAMKDSGVPWLGEVSEHWTVKRNKLFVREIDERRAATSAVSSPVRALDGQRAVPTLTLGLKGP